MEDKATYNWIYCLAEQLVINNKNLKRNQGIYFKIEIDCEQYGYEKDGNTFHKHWKNRCYLIANIVVVKPHNVFVSIGDTTRWTSDIATLVPTNFTNLSNHDSCWKDSINSKLIELSFNAWKEAYKFTPEDHIPAPIAANITCSPCILNKKLLQFVEVELENIPKDYYHYTMKEIKAIPMNTISLSD